MTTNDHSLTVTIDDATNEILGRVAPGGDPSAYVRAAIIEKAARDEKRDELDDLRDRLDVVGH